jgi:large subunit ribosomal protein L9
MFVVLKENVEKLGVIGETVYVKPGFGRNYLIPRELAVSATSSEAKKLISDYEKAKERAEEKKENIAGSITLPDLEFKVKSKKDGTTYTAVSAAKIKKELGERRIEVKKVELKESIKKIGDHQVKVKLMGEKEARSIKVKVEAL